MKIKDLPSRSEKITKSITKKLAETKVKEGIDLDGLARELARRNLENDKNEKD